MTSETGSVTELVLYRDEPNERTGRTNTKIYPTMNVKPADP